MAEGFGNKYLTKYNINSAGTNPENINLYAIKAMKQIGIDISNHKSTKINNNKLNLFDLVITLCGDAKDKCPILNVSKHIHWDIPDPATFNGNDEEKTLKFCETRDIIFNYIKLLKEELNK